MEDRTLLSAFLVNNISDSGPGSLRQAILDSNAATGKTNTIDFAIPGGGVQTITPLTALPAIVQAVLIDGFSQPGYASTPLIQIDGSEAGSGDGLTITGSNVTVRGLDVSNFNNGAGIHVTGPAATGNWIYGNFLGTDPTGTQALPNDYGVEIDGGASRNLIGTNGDGANDVAERNLISGNLFAGVWINGQGTDGNAVAGNFIGTSVTGDVALDNATAYVSFSSGINEGGVVIDGGASGNRIGTDGLSSDDASQRNVIAGTANYAPGIGIFGTGTDGNMVAGNYIGTDLTGTMSLGIAGGGVDILGGASANWVGVNPDGGGAVSDEGNVISGNGFAGVFILLANSNVIAGDKIGTDATGEVALGNSSAGVEIDTSSGNTIGGTGAGEADVISGNQVWSHGVSISGGDDNVVVGDKIGTDATGAVALGNYVGVEIDSSSGNTIGGTGGGAADVISGNRLGVELGGASNNLVEGDFIGTDATGTKALGNLVVGVEVDANGGPSTDNTIGGTSAIAGNLITDNGGPGVTVTGDGSVGNQITLNRIFGNAGQAIDLGNDGVTYNSPSPRQGPNNFQNFPVIGQTAGGQTEGWLGGSTPNTPFRLDFFASAAYGPGASGEEQDDLGSLEVTTDASGEVSFAVPFSAPAGLPIITATATDP
jgi:titin